MRRFWESFSRSLLVAGGLIAALALFGFDRLDEVHTELLESHPPADSVIQQPVEEILLVFTTPVQAEVSRIRIQRADGWSPETEGVVHPSTETPERLVARLPEALPAGSFRVQWSTMSPDGHVVEGAFAFRVGGDDAFREQTEDAPTSPAQAADSAVPEEAEDGLVPEGTAQRWIHLLGTVLLLGVVVFRSGVLSRRGKGARLAGVAERARKPLRRFAWISAILLLITLGTRLFFHLNALGAGAGTAWEYLPHVLVRTGWGAGWWLHLAAVVLLFIGLLYSNRQGSAARGWATVVGAAVLLPLVEPLQGHAMGAGARAVAIPVMYFHVAAVGIWLGGLLMLVLVGLPAVRRAGESDDSLPALARLVNSFSRIALPAVALIVLTGGLNAFLLGTAPEDLIGSAWGRTLLLKLAVLGGVFLLGFYNWRKVRPSLAEHPDPGILRIPATVEAVLGIIVLLVTAVLAATPLP